MLAYIESFTPAIYHAAPSVPETIDAILYKFLAALGISARDAFLRFNSAPLEARRNIAMLGVLHRVALGEAPGALSDMCPQNSVSPSTRTTRTQRGLHNKQFFDSSQTSADLMRPSVFGSIAVYNALPQFVVDAATVKLFQCQLQNAVKLQARIGLFFWHLVLSRTYLPPVMQFQRFVG